MLICKNDKTKKYKGTEPSPKGLGYCAHAEKTGTIKKGKNKEIWIIKKSSNGTKKWIKFYEIYDLTKIHQFHIIRSNSVIVAKKGKKQICTLDEKGNLYIKMSSKYVPSADSQIIELNIGKINITNEFNGLEFKYKKICYHIYYNLSSKRSSKLIKIIDKIFDKYVKKLSSNKVWKLICSNDSNNITKEHHYGNLILFYPHMLKQMKKGKKYYIVWQQGWNSEYTGYYNIAVMDYIDTRRSGSEVGIYGDIIQANGSIYGKKQYGIIHSYNSKEPFVSHGGDDPVHLVTKWRKGFKPPSSLPKANLFKKKD
jgi:hypothetical protein